MRNWRLLGLALFVGLVGCDSGSAEDTTSGSGSGVTASTPEERAIVLENFLQEEEAQGGSECLSSPLAGTCFDVLHNGCFRAEGECEETAPTGASNLWTWDDGSTVTFDYAGLGEDTAWYSAFTGKNADGETCFEGVMKYDMFELKRVLSFKVGDSILERIDYLGTKELPYTEYVCADGSFFRVEVDQISKADACMFGPNAKACGFLKAAGTTLGDGE